MVLSLAGAAAGVVGALAISAVIGRFLQWSAPVSLESVVLAVGFSSAIGVVFGLYPAQRAAAVVLVEALRSE